VETPATKSNGRYRGVAGVDQTPEAANAWQAPADVYKDLPLLGYYASDANFREAQPFRDVFVIILLHFLQNLRPLVAAMRDLGMAPGNALILHKGPGYRYPHKEEVAVELASWGYRVQSFDEVVTPEGQDQLLAAARQRVGAGQRILVVEDGGHITPILLRDPVVSAGVCGAVEQTTRGIWNIKEAAGGSPIPFPVVSLPDSILKQRFEPPQIAAAADRAVANMLVRRAPAIMKAAVLGVGAIGSALVRQLNAQGLPVRVFDPDPQARLLALNLPCQLCCTAEDAVSGADLVFGATGRTSIHQSVINHLKHDAFVASVSSEQVEVDVRYLARSATQVEVIRYEYDPAVVIGKRYLLRPNRRAVNLLGDGFPINFVLDFGGMADQAADLVVTLLFLAPVEMLTGTYAGRSGILTDAVNEYVRKHEVCEHYLQIWT
jgi:S-adenosylhomocysteine hydrolase